MTTTPTIAGPGDPALDEILDGTTALLLARLEACELAAGDFHHRDHVRAAWGMLRARGLLDTLERYPEAIRRLARHLGAPGKYHETITWAFLFLVHERMGELPAGHGWDEFAASSNDLLLDHRATLLRHYTADRLDSELARRTFLLPAVPAPSEASP